MLRHESHDQDPWLTALKCIGAAGTRASWGTPDSIPFSSASVMTRTLCFSAASILVRPGASPVTRKEVFLDTDPVTFPPASSMSRITSSRDRASSPVMTKAFPFRTPLRRGSGSSGVNGGPRGYAAQGIRKAIDRAGLNDPDVVKEKRGKVTIHTLRHTFASRLVQTGVSLAKVSKLLGHSSVTTTEIYAHLAPNEVSEEATKVLNGLHR